MEWRDDLEAIKTLGILRVLYLRLLYRPHMRFIHKRGRHKMKRLHPMGGPAFYRCDWCGHTAPSLNEKAKRIGEQNGL